MNYSQRSLGLSPLLLVAMVNLTLCLGALGQTNVTTQHNDIARTGANANETILTPANTNTSTFGKLFSHPVDGYVYAQPLYVTGVKLGAGTSQAGTTHNVVFIATEHDSVYAFDADSNGGANASPLWSVTLLDAAHGAAAGATSVPQANVASADLVPEIGITGTPVIDGATNTLYVVSKSKENGTFVQRLHGLDVTTGQEKFGGPTTIAASVAGNGNGSSGGTLKFDPLWELNRPGLLLVNGIVYMGFAAHGDNGPWHGWILAYNATTLQQTGAWCASPNSLGSGIWMSGAGLAADIPSGKPYGRMFTVTGNGLFDTSAQAYGDSILRLDLTNGTFAVSDYFTPHDQAALSGADTDQASGGVLLLPDSVGGGSGQHQLVQIGKSGRVYVMNRESLGGYTSTNSTDPQEKANTSGVWGAPAYWNGRVYIWGKSDRLKSFAFANGTITSSTPTSSSAETAQTYSPTPSISANGTTNGIVWSLKTDNFGTNGQAILYAHDATNVASLLYSSTQNAARDNPGASVKFAVPTVANGKVYVGTETQVSVFGLLNGSSQAQAPVISPAGKSFTGTLQVTITDSTPGASIYYTTDGSTPTTASTLYTGPFTVSTTTTVSATASASGYLQSTVVTQTYTLQTQALSPTFSPLPGNYTTALNITIADATPGSSIYYTTDGSTPNPGTGTTKLYSAAIPISTTTTVKAVATATGLSISPVSSSSYTITLPGTTIDFSAGFGNSAASMTFNGSTGLDDVRLQLTNGGTNQAGSAFYNTPVNIQAFTTDFSLQLSNAGADGITFTIQNAGLTALGSAGGGLGYGPAAPGGAPGITPSVAIKFDTYSNQGEGTSSTGLYTNGASPTVPSINLLSAGLDLRSGTLFSAHLVYDGTTLSMTLSDPVAGKTFSTSWTIDIPGTVGNSVAYLGFTGGTGGQTSSQKIGTWTFTSNGQQATSTPTISPSTGTYLGTQIVTISDATSGASIYYTTDGTTPTVASSKYNGPLAVTATQTIKAIAKAATNSVSAIATATLTIQSQVAAPSYSPAGGTYTGPQTVAITTASPGATIYFTTNGTTPSSSSTRYVGPITVSTSQTIQAIALASGFFDSNVTSATYTIGSTVTNINLGSGFATGTMILNGSASISGTRLRVTNNGSSEASSAWYTTPINVQQFTTNFSFQITGGGTGPTGDGFAFVIQNSSSGSLGPAGGGLGYGPDGSAASANLPIGKSVAVKFDLYGNAGEGSDSTGLYINGASPTMPAVDMSSSGVNLHTTNVFNAQLKYDGTNLTLTLTDTVTNAVFTKAWPINITSTVGGNAAWVGFTGGTGGNTSIQDIIGWTMTSSSSASPAATPTFSPAGGIFTTAQTVAIADSTSGAAIYYTTDGTTPTTASTKYTSPVTVGSTTTIRAIAVATGFTQSAIGSAAYTITPTTATPVITPATGTYGSSQTVTLSDATSGATMYFTTDGTTPTTASTKYTASFAVTKTTTVKAIAAATGFATSAVATTVITIQAATPAVNFGSGFSPNGMQLNGHAALNGTKLRLTDTATGPEVGSAFWTQKVNVQNFTSDFTFQLTSPIADGFTFTIQGIGPTVIGPVGGGLGFGPAASGGTGGIGSSVAVKFDFYNNAGEGSNSTGLYTNGASPTLPSTTLGNGVNLLSGHPFKVHMTYDGTTLTMTISDTTNSAQTFVKSWTVSIPTIVGGNTAYVGFTGATGGSTAIQEILSWTYSSSTTTPVVYHTSNLVAVSSGPVFRTFIFDGFPDTTGTILDATKVGDNVKFSVNVAAAGTYDIKLSYKGYYSRGIAQLSINGIIVGAASDQFAATDTYATFDFGAFNFPAAGNYSFQFTVAGKNPSSSNYSISFDELTLTPQ